MKIMAIAAVDLFCGIGGLSYLSDILKGMKEYEVKKKYLISRN